MIAEKRYEIILSTLRSQRSATVQQLAQALHTSVSTVRRDLIVLDSQGRLKKVHGGATLSEERHTAAEPDMLTKEGMNIPQKQAIGRLAAAMIRPDDFVFIDAGSTTLQLVRAIEGDALRAVYVTNGLAHTRVLCRKGCNVYVPAGKVRQRTEAIVGAPALSCIRSYNFTRAFLGVNGISLDRGFTTPGMDERELKLAAIESARESWFLADMSKFDHITPVTICSLSRAGIITNRLPNPGYADYTTIQEVEL